MSKKKKEPKKEVKKERLLYIVLAEFNGYPMPRAFGGFCTNAHAKVIKKHLEENIDEAGYVQIVPITIGEK